MSSVRIWEKSYELRRRLLRGFFLRRGSPTEDAEDLAQEVYLRLLRSTGENAEAVANPEAYLFTVAANLAREHARARSALPPLEDVELLAEVLKSEEDVEGEFERRQRWSDIRSTIARLPPTTRRMMELHYRDGLECPQISAQLDVSVHMVRKHIGKGLDACRKALGAGEDA
ncbi:sigma-70 family RNA polymerase sigma factor [Xanthomonas sp. AM6]|uniref:RNA polymerase sigma factor n=1 Tax=Xanthomonas sp. AM6 TaxID=2982531 RepID=UPI0021D8016F|nr:sigma-70 family RNA polymerase sigma factor [Xanthomonas sp. AM6]UYB51072.1 sigma-70 family RNA polymerase sigma factor [Xanthomonas sp. AM6]